MTQNSWEQRSTLVIGGAGFCGAHLCEALLERDARVAVLDQCVDPHGYFAHSALAQRVQFHQGDLLDLASLKLFLERFEFDTVFLLAAQPIVSISNAQPLETAHTNIIGTYNVLEAIRLARRQPQLIFASSGAYYGATQTAEPIPEEAPALVASNIYAPTKAAADLAVRCYAKIYGLRAATCRWMNTYGAGDTNFTRIVPATIRRLMNGEPALIDGTDGSNVLEVLHVRDMAAAYLAVAENLERKNVRGEAFNFGGGAPLTLRELVVKIIRAWNAITHQNVSEEPLIAGPHTTSVKYLDTAKARAALSWQPRVDLQQGLQETVRWYRTFS
jgi:CDP-glucose 4,6-dehydratase